MIKICLAYKGIKTEAGKLGKSYEISERKKIMMEDKSMETLLTFQLYKIYLINI